MLFGGRLPSSLWSTTAGQKSRRPQESRAGNGSSVRQPPAQRNAANGGRRQRWRQIRHLAAAHSVQQQRNLAELRLGEPRSRELPPAGPAQPLTAIPTGGSTHSNAASMGAGGDGAGQPDGRAGGWGWGSGAGRALTARICAAWPAAGSASTPAPLRSSAALLPLPAAPRAPRSSRSARTSPAPVC